MPIRARTLIRILLRWVVAAIACAPIVAGAQAAGKVAKVGMVSIGAPKFGVNPVQQGFLAGMRDHGYIEGQHFVMELRSIEGKPERYAERFRELVQLPVDLIAVPVCGVQLDAARRATQTIPIVVLTCNDDLVETSAVASLNRPGGNLTGLSKLTPELAPKRLQLLKQTVPTISRVAVLWNPGYSDFKADWRELRAGAAKLGVTLHPVEVRRAEDFDAAFAAIARERAEAVITFSDVLTFAHAKRVADLAAAARLPLISPFRELPDAGALMSYGPNLSGMWCHAAGHVVKILKGAKPAEMPIEQPTRFELVYNKQAAKALGLTIPTSMLLLADHVVE